METASTAPLAAARSRLGWALAQRLLDATPTDNVFLSPHSVAGALAVAQAAGVVEAESIGRLLESDDPAAHAAISASLLDADPEGVELRLAQSLWTDLSIGFARADLVRRHFPEVEWRARDFRDEATVDEINAWAAEATDGMIDKIIDRLLGSEVLAVLDAILFVGTWTHRFDPERTRPAPFRTGAGATVEVPLMELDEKFAYGEGDGWRAVRLPYGQGRLGLLVVLPDEGLPLAAFARAFAWDAVPGALRSVPGVVRLPRFRVDTLSDLHEHLEALGLGPPDAPQLDQVLKISRILQRAVLEVDEKGTRAAAVTFLGAEITSLPPPPFDFTADRPFLCAIHDRETDSLLFVGAIQDPEPIIEEEGETRALRADG